jgi:hypothetical protein
LEAVLRTPARDTHSGLATAPPSGDGTDLTFHVPALHLVADEWGPMQRAVIVYGLPPTFTVAELSALLNQFGVVQSVRLSPRDHASFIIGYGEMKHRDEARRAVKALHGTVIGGQTLIVHRSMPLS